MTCIDCGREIDQFAPCGLAVCDGCCAVCYKQDEPCEDMEKLEYLNRRNRAIIAGHKAGETTRELSAKYGISANFAAQIIHDGYHPAQHPGPQ